MFKMLTGVSLVAGCLYISACSQISAKSISGDDIGATSLAAINLYQKKPLESWGVWLKDYAEEKPMTGDPSVLADGKVLLSADKDGTKEGALVLKFHDIWYSELKIKSENSFLDLRPYVNRGGVVSFDINLEDIRNSALEIDVSGARVKLRDWALSNQGKGWVHASVALSCFAASADLSKVTEAFALRVGGKGQFRFANVQFNTTESANVECPDPTLISITPKVSNDFWAIDWWMPRHEEKVAQAREGKAELVMIGDSITNYWENTAQKPSDIAGKKVWDAHFSNINTLNLGFGGDRTENVIWRLEHGEIDHINPKLAVLMIGTNNTGMRMDKPEYIAQGVEKIIDLVQHKLPNTKIVVLAIFPCGELPQDPSRVNNEAASRLIKKVAENKGAEFKDIGSVFLTKDGVLSRDIMTDLLHPNTKGYELWASQLEPIFKKYLGK